LKAPGPTGPLLSLESSGILSSTALTHCGASFTESSGIVLVMEGSGILPEPPIAYNRL